MVYSKVYSRVDYFDRHQEACKSASTAPDALTLGEFSWDKYILEMLTEEAGNGEFSRIIDEAEVKSQSNFFGIQELKTLQLIQLL